MNIIGRIFLILVSMIAYRPADAEVFVRLFKSVPENDIKNCTLEYSKSVKEITMATAKEAHDCYIKKISPLQDYGKFVLNRSVDRVNDFCNKRQDTISNCVTRNPDEVVLGCYMTTLQQILQNLYKLENKFELEARLFSAHIVKANAIGEDCTVMALSNSDLKTSIALKTFNTCITEIKLEVESGYTDLSRLFGNFHIQKSYKKI